MTDENSPKRGGWIKVFRSIQKNWVWMDKPFAKGQAWIDLLLLANHSDAQYVNRYGKIIDIRRGYVCRSERELSEKWGWSRSKVRNFFRQLEHQGMIEILEKSTTDGTMIYISRYSDYQKKNTIKKTTEKPRRNHGETTEGHKQECKECKECKEERENREKVPATRLPDGGASGTEEDDAVDLSAMSDEEFAKFKETVHGNV